MAKHRPEFIVRSVIVNVRSPSFVHTSSDTDLRTESGEILWFDHL